MHAVPRDVEHLDQQQLQQPVVAQRAQRDAAALGGERDAAVALVLEQAQLVEPAQHPRHGAGRDAEPLRQRVGRHRALEPRLERVDGLEVILDRARGGGWRVHAFRLVPTRVWAALNLSTMCGRDRRRRTASPRRSDAAAGRARRGPVRGRLALLGPAFVAAVAYIDPGNFATNIAGGAKYGFLLVWVIVAANLMAMLVQYLSAKVGVATGLNLPELCRAHLPRPATSGLWVQAEIIAIATDLAEFVGAADRAQPAVRRPRVRGRPDHRGRGVRDPRAPAARLPALRAGDRGLPRDRLPRLPLRPVAGVGRHRRAARRVRPRLRGQRQRDARGRHPRRHRDAARGLPARRARAGPHPAARRCRAALAAALPARRRRDRDGARGRDQPDDARRRGLAVPRERVDRHREHRGRARGASSG